jgi:hypothetical protein
MVGGRDQWTSDQKHHLMAENLAASDEEHSRLTPSHIDKLLNAILEFCDYNWGNAARAGKIQLSGPSY